MLNFLKKFTSLDSLKEESSALHCVILAVFSREKIFESPEVVQAVLDLLATSTKDLDAEVRGDLVRYIIMTRMRSLLKPDKVTEDLRPSEDSPEALIMQSDLLSGGLETHLFYLFDTKALTEMQKDAKMSQGQEILPLVEKALEAKKNGDSLTEVYTDEDNVLRQVQGTLEGGQTEMIDMLVLGMQAFMRSKPSMTYSRIGGPNGSKLTRIAFAVMIKMAGLATDLTQLLDELDYASMSLPEEEGPEKELSILETLQANASFEKIKNSWVAASKMRIWLNGKKQSLVGKLTNE